MAIKNEQRIGENFEICRYSTVTISMLSTFIGRKGNVKV